MKRLTKAFIDGGGRSRDLEIEAQRRGGCVNLWREECKPLKQPVAAVEARLVVDEYCNIDTYVSVFINTCSLILK